MGPAVDWLSIGGAPDWARRLMASLQQPDATDIDLDLGDRWPSALEFLDRNQLTLAFGAALEHRLPAEIQERIARNRASNAIRIERLRNEYDHIADAFRARGVDHLLLKGFSHRPPRWLSTKQRMQFDLDLLVEPSEIQAAARVLHDLGFESTADQERFPSDHLAPFVRRTGWQWRGDFFDPEIPPVVELHFRLWDAATEGFPVPELDGCWARREWFELGADDQILYASAHLLRHLLRGSAKAFHVSELAHAIPHAPARELDWRLAFPLHLASAWFAPHAEPPGALPQPARTWLSHYAASPLAAQFQAVKPEVWLHWEMLDAWSSRLRVARRRFLPTAAPGPLDGAFDRDRPSTQEALRRLGRYAKFFSQRAARHAVALPVGLWQGVQWRWLRRRRGKFA